MADELVGAVVGGVVGVVVEVVLEGVFQAGGAIWSSSSWSSWSSPAACSDSVGNVPASVRVTSSAAPPRSSTSTSPTASTGEPFTYTKRVTKSGFLVKEGHLWRSWKRRWFTLRGTTLAYFHSCEHDEELGRIELLGAQVSTLKRFTDATYGERICIKVEDEHNGKVFYLFPTDQEGGDSEEEQLMDWLTAIEKCQAKAAQQIKSAIDSEL